MKNTIRTRFAPSPTGYLHIGGARTAIFNYLLAKKNEGKFILRIEDTDEKRNTDEAINVILENLKWLGIDWDEGPEKQTNTTNINQHNSYFQSQRKKIYSKYLKKLIDNNKVYLDDGAYRFKLQKIETGFQDLICGNINFNLENEPDITIQRPDGSFTFHFVNVIDDIEMNISHVIRGEDHLINTCKHIQLYQALEEKIPKFAHIPLTLNENGTKMSKSDQGGSIRDYIEMGFLPQAVLNYLCFLGWSPKDDSLEILSKAQLIDLFNFNGFNRNPAKFDYQKCLWINSQHLYNLDDEEYIKLATDFLKNNKNTQNTIKNISDENKITAFLLIKNKIKTFNDIPSFLSTFFDEKINYSKEIMDQISSVANFKKIIQKYIEILSNFNKNSENLSESKVEEIILKISEFTDVKKGKIMFATRMIFTGAKGGADLLPMLVLIGKTNLLKRISQISDILSK